MRPEVTGIEAVAKAGAPKPQNGRRVSYKTDKVKYDIRGAERHTWGIHTLDLFPNCFGSIAKQERILEELTGRWVMTWRPHP